MVASDGPIKKDPDKPVCRRINRAHLVAYSKFLAGQLLWYRHMANICEQKLRILNEHGILRDGVADDYSIQDLMHCKIVEG